MAFAADDPQGQEAHLAGPKNFLLVYLKNRDSDDALEMVQKRLPALENAILAGKAHVDLLSYLPAGKCAEGFVIENEAGIELYRWYREMTRSGLGL